MRITWIIRTAVAAVSAAGLSLGGASVATAAPLDPPIFAGEGNSSAVATLDTAVAEDLSYMREEERLVRDLYLAIAEAYPENASPFERIARAEQRHYDAVGTLITRYGIDDPASGLKAGSYADETLTALYKDSLEKAKVSLTDAYGVGVAMETTDIADLEKILNGSPMPDDVTQVMSNLLAGSERHLNAFTALSEGKTPGNGTGSGPQDRGNVGTGHGKGLGQGNGQGQGMGNGPGNGQGHGRTGERPADCPMQ